MLVRSSNNERKTRTIEEYLSRYAKDYCDGNIEEAKSHAIVQEVLKSKTEDIQHKNESDKICIMQYLENKGMAMSAQVSQPALFAL